MEDMVCSSCHKGLSLEEIERGSFKHLGGRVYCAECVAKMRRVGPTLCPQCGVQDTPLYNGQEMSSRAVDCGAQPYVDPIGSEASRGVLEGWRALYRRSPQSARKNGAPPAAPRPKKGRPGIGPGPRGATARWV